MTGLRLGRERSARMLRICLAGSLFPPAMGGEERIADLLACGLAGAGHEVSVVTRRLPGASSVEVRKGVRVHRCIRPMSRGPLFGPTYAASLGAFLIRRRDLDLVQTSYLYWDAVTAALLKPLLGIRLVVRVVVAGPGGDLDRFTGMRLWPVTARLDKRTLDGLVRQVFRRADAFVVLNEAIVRELAAHGIPRSRCHIVPNGIETGAYDGRASGGRAAGPWRIVSVGRLTAQKGQDLLLRALPRVRTAAGPLALTLVGDGPDRARLEALAATLGLGDAVRFTGQVENVRPILAEADLFVLASRFEGHPLALLEAMDAALPIVATAVAGNADTLRAGEGLLVPPEDPEALAEAMASLLVDREGAAHLGVAASHGVVERYSVDAMIARTLEVYYAVCASPRGTRAEQ